MTHARAPRVLILAGEESGDRHGASVARALKRHHPEATLIGTGGVRMKEAGVRLLARIEELALMGFVEVLSHLPDLLRLEREIRGLLRRGEVDLVLPIDYPGFNLRVARTSRRAEIPVLYFIAPQVWAWKKGRARRLARDADRVAVVLPFEETLLEREGVDVTFVGHPLLDEEPVHPGREGFCRTLGLDPERPILALFPGSRDQELHRHLELFLEAARQLAERHPELQIAAARPRSLSAERYRSLGLPATLCGRSLLRHARAAIVKSGTSTLQATLEATPFVTVYRTSSINFFLARRLVKVQWIALVNLVADAPVIPELIQREATPENILREVEPFLDPKSTRRRRVMRDLEEVSRSLGTPGASERVASIASALLRDGVPESNARVPTTSGPGDVERGGSGR